MSSAAAWPVVAQAQQGDRVRRVGVLRSGDENDPLGKSFVSALTEALANLGWTVGRNVQMELRWYGDNINRTRALAQELVGLEPDIILATTTPVTVAVQRETRTIPIVFVNVADPVAQHIVARLDRPSLIRSPHRAIYPHLRQRPGHSKSCQSLRPFTATQRSKRPSSTLGASREAALSSCRVHS
jgi:ABC transporter substrate binding protein